MERFQQETKYSGSVNTGLWDGGFAPTTLLKRGPTSSLNALSTRDSRVGDKKVSQSTRKPTSFDSRDEDSGSSDELDLFRSPRVEKKPVPQKKRAYRTVVKSKKGETTSNELRQGRPTTSGAKPPKKKKKSTTDSEDEISVTPARPVANKKSVEKAESPKAKAPVRTKNDAGGNTTKKEAELWKKRPTTDIGESIASEEESVNDAVKEKVTSRRKGPLKPQYTPRPFPMDLSDSPMAGSSRATSSTPHVASLRTKPGASSNARSHQKNVESAESSGSYVFAITFAYIH
jgi:hypothetical protein